MPLRQIKDALLQDSVNLPAGATTVYSDSFDLGKGEKYEKMEIHVEIPSLTLTELPNGTTITAKIFSGDSEAPTNELAVIGKVTGVTANNPSEAVVLRYRHPPTVGQFIRIGLTGVANVAASSKAAMVSLVF